MGVLPRIAQDTRNDRGAAAVWPSLDTPFGFVGRKAMGARHRIGVSVCGLLGALPALADPAPAYLVEDINTAADLYSFRTSDSEVIADLGGIAYFVGRSQEAGYELWRSDGTQAGTTLVKDIRVGAEPTSSESYAITTPPQSLTIANGTLFFTADDGAHGRELWKSDGTSAGTTMVKDIRPGATGSFSSLYPHKLENVNGVVYFTADDGVHGLELWKSDGTSAGTELVKDVFPGAAGSSWPDFPSQLANVNGILFFSATGGLWKSDGTSAGTVMVKGIANSVLRELTGVDDRLFFWRAPSSFDQSPAELWTSDGTSDGTVALAGLGNIDFEGLDEYSFSLTNFDGRLFFRAADGELWKSDGTAAGTLRVKDIRPGTAGGFCGQPTDVNGTLFFYASDGTTGCELWKTDGTEAGTALVKDIRPGLAGSNFDFSASRSFANVNGTLFFAADDGASGDALWKSDGTDAGTVLVKDLQPVSANPSMLFLTNVGGTLFFAGRENSVAVFHLWKSDGTPAGTSKLQEGPAAATSSSLPDEATFLFLLFPNLRGDFFADVDGTLFFAARVGAGAQLWKSDGTSAGTTPIKEFPLGDSVNGLPFYLTNVNGTLFFQATDGVHGTELWKSDGTAAGTVMVKDIATGPKGSRLRELTNVNDTLFFVAEDVAYDMELWKSDGTEAGTVRVKDIAASRSSEPQWLTNVNGTLFFTADDGVSGRELWRSNGAESGTVRVQDIYPGTGSSTPLELENVNGTLFFTVFSSLNSGGPGVWKSDGTASGTVQVSARCRDPRSFTAVGGTLFFTASPDQHDRELWMSDGTGAGTVLVKDINPGGTTSNPQFLTNANGMLFFAADDGIHGLELWKSDGTPAGTALVEDIFDGAASGHLGRMKAVGSRVVFQGNDGISGEELWTSDGTAAGTHLVADVAANGGSRAEPLTAIEPLLFFSAYTDELGRELYAVPTTALGDGDGDGDGVADSDDACVPSPPGAVVNADGCAIADLCACAQPESAAGWRNHGAYVACVAHAANDFAATGLISRAQSRAIVSQAAESCAE
jgi:ELWxxDGT repeat protein